MIINKKEKAEATFADVSANDVYMMSLFTPLATCPGIP